MRKKKKVNNKGAAIVLIYILFGVMLLSLVCSLLGFRGDQTYISRGNIESSMITVKNIFSREGLSFFFGNFLKNFQNLSVVGLLVVSIMCVSIGESSGLFNSIFSKLKNIKLVILTFVVVILSILLTCIDENMYILLIPLVGVMYKSINRNPVLGIFTTFIGSTIGSAACAIFNYNTYTLGMLTQAAATVDVDPNYVFSFNSSFIIKIISLFVIAIFSTIIIKKKLFNDYGKVVLNDEIKSLEEDEEEEKKVVSKKSTWFYVALAIMVLLLAYMLIPNLYKSGLLLDSEELTYGLKLLGENSPFRISFVYLFTIFIMILSYIYGKSNGTFKNTNDYSYGLFKDFSGVGYVFVLLFLLSQIVAVVEWTNLANVVVVTLINFISNLQFSGILLILFLFIITVIIIFILPEKISIWTLMAPVVIPLFMRANINPDFTQFVFNASSSVAYSLTPIYPALIILLAYVNKYTKENEKFNFASIYKLLMPTLSLIIVLWVMIILTWYIAGIPIGSGIYPTL